jgi:hypothetical protein
MIMVQAGSSDHGGVGAAASARAFQTGRPLADVARDVLVRQHQVQSGREFDRMTVGGTNGQVGMRAPAEAEREASLVRTLVMIADGLITDFDIADLFDRLTTACVELRALRPPG